ncbi:MAG: bifunctional riboflavin kinase/FAD synthetase [bacterium]|nr:bifunctional riboflavin kinase/FAD synthetase [bacterium]
MDLIYKPFTNQELTGSWAVLIGNFDGFHRGHQVLARRLCEESKRLGAKSAILTFDPHPKQVLQPTIPFYQLYPNESKWRLIEQAGLDACLIAPFTHKFSALAAEDFLDRLFRYIDLKKLLVGYDFNFGKGREGGAHLLEQVCRSRGIEFEKMAPVKLDGLTVSSTMIRRLLFEGDFISAEKFLGRRWAIEGAVMPGHRKGHDLGFPTLNLPSAAPLPLRLGVYQCEVALGGKLYPGVCNLGFKPTFEGQSLVTEAHLFGFDREAYGEWIQVFPIKFLREEERFGSFEALSRQIAVDVALAKELFGR